MWSDFRKFVMRGNVVDLAVGVVIGAAFGAIVTSLVNDLLMPPIGLALGGADFTDLFLVLNAGDPVGPYATLAAAQEAGAVTLNYGVFLTRLMSFLIVAASIFLLVRGIERMRRTEEAPAAAPVTRDCPFCLSTIPIKATRCPHCTSEVQA